VQVCASQKLSFYVYTWVERAIPSNYWKDQS